MRSAAASETVLAAALRFQQVLRFARSLNAHATRALMQQLSVRAYVGGCLQDESTRTDRDALAHDDIEPND